MLGQDGLKHAWDGHAIFSTLVPGLPGNVPVTTDSTESFVFNNSSLKLPGSALPDVLTTGTSTTGCGLSRNLICDSSTRKAVVSPNEGAAKNAAINRKATARKERKETIRFSRMRMLPELQSEVQRQRKQSRAGDVPPLAVEPIPRLCSGFGPAYAGSPRIFGPRARHTGADSPQIERGTESQRGLQSHHGRAWTGGD